MVNPYDWAEEFDNLSKTWMVERDFAAMARANDLGTLMQKAHPTPDHFIPALYCAGLVHDKDQLSFFNEGIDAGCVSMRSFVYA